MNGGNYGQCWIRCAQGVWLGLYAAGAVACAPQAPLENSVAEQSDSSTLSEVAPSGARDLTVSVADKKGLLSVNALLVEEPLVPAGVTLRGVETRELQGIIEEIASQELSLKVYGGEWIRKNIKTAAKSVPASAGIDAILVTEMLEYREREGSRVGGEPGAVAFRMTVVRLSDRSEVWGATYSLREESVTDNLFRLGERVGAGSSGLGWQSSREIFKGGVARALESFSSTREAQFLTP